MTFDDDFVQVEIPGQQLKRFGCASNGIDWPPPETMPYFNDVLLVRQSMSSITDTERADMTHVARGALYVPKEPA